MGILSSSIVILCLSFISVSFCTVHGQTDCFQYEDRINCLQSCNCNWCTILANQSQSLCIDSSSISTCKFSGGSVEYYGDTEYCQYQTKIILISILIPFFCLFITLITIFCTIRYPNGPLGRFFFGILSKCINKFKPIQDQNV